MGYQDYLNQFNSWLSSIGITISDPNPTDSPYFATWLKIAFPNLSVSQIKALAPAGTTVTTTPAASTSSSNLLGMSTSTLLLVAGGLALLLFLPKRKKRA